MSSYRTTEMWCDLCDLRQIWDNRIEAMANGWKRDRWSDGQVLDLCPSCAGKVLVHG